MKQRILNVGCGDDTYGTDFVDVYPHRKEVIKCNIEKEKLPFRKNTFDEVYSSFVFEHFKNPSLALKEMARVLKKGGKIEIHTDNAGWWGYHNSKSKYRVHYGGYHFGTHGKEDRHYALYTTYHMGSHFKEAGLKVISCEIYQRDKLGIPMTIINELINKTRFKWMAYPQIRIIGRKI